MRKNTVISFIGLLFCLCIQAQGTSTSVNSTVNDVDWARAEKFSSDALEQYIKRQKSLIPTGLKVVLIFTTM